jgi:hypothetical protein
MHFNQLRVILTQFGAVKERIIDTSALCSGWMWVKKYVTIWAQRPAHFA